MNLANRRDFGNGEITAVAARLLESYPEIRRFARLSGWSGTDSNLHATFSAVSKAIGTRPVDVCHQLGLEQITSPSATASKVDLTVVQAMFAVRPELDRGRTHAKPGPARR